MSAILTTYDQLAKIIRLTEKEQAWFSSENYRGASPSCKIPEYYAGLIRSDDPLDPIRRQCIPSSEEALRSAYELSDPLGERAYTPVARLIHRYTDRALFLSTDECLMYCRHCFRRTFTSSGKQAAGKKTIEAAAAYVREHKEIRELLISGGDPLTLDDRRLNSMLEIFRWKNPSLLIRVCTRVPVVYPQRITAALVSVLENYLPLIVVTQYNHPWECTDESMKKTDMLIHHGISVLNQTVLLRHVNDRAEVLCQLFTALHANRIKPYYLFQGDLAEGTSHLRVSILKSFEIVRQLMQLMPESAMPKFAVDLPGGGGKVLLLEQEPHKKEPQKWGYESNGKLYWYPIES